MALNIRIKGRANWALNTITDNVKAIGASPNAVRMQKVVSFYEKLPRGPAPEPQAKGLLGRYQKAYFGKNVSARRKSSPRVAYLCNSMAV